VKLGFDGSLEEFPGFPNQKDAAKLSSFGSLEELPEFKA
jgi:hypothetical protein